MNGILQGVTSCSLYTGTFGRKGCTGNCLGCYIGDTEFKEDSSVHQGTVDQVHELLSVLPNLKRVFIFGNPDPSVDPKFCNEAARIFQSKGIKVLFVTNGFGGTETIKTLIDGLQPSLISGIAFSIDSLDDKKNSAMKGTRIPLADTLQSMEYVQSMGINTKVYFAIWLQNMDENWKAFVNFFESRGVHVGNGYGSVQAARGRIEHVPEEKILEIQEKYADIRLPTLLANDEDYEEYLSTFVAKNQFKCTNFDHIKVYFTEKALKSTYYCPIIPTIYPKYLVNIRDIGKHEFHDELIKTGCCPVSKFALGFECKKTRPVCRFYKKLPKTAPTKELKS